MSIWKEQLKRYGIKSHDFAPDVPKVRVCDENGKELFKGWYVGHINRCTAPLGDRVRSNDVDHIVAHDGFADWNMPRSVVLTKVTPPHYIEVVG